MDPATGNVAEFLNWLAKEQAAAQLEYDTHRQLSARNCACGAIDTLSKVEAQFKRQFCQSSANKKGANLNG